jgi:hypothetical protein
MEDDHREQYVRYAVFHWRRLPMARTRALLLFAAVLLVLSGCKAFFEFNAFSSLDKTSVPDPSRYQGASGLANLQADLLSTSVVNALKGDPATVAIILNNLNTSYGVTGTLTTPDQQIAAILYSNLALQTTSGDVLVNNIVANVLTTPTGNLATVLQAVVPPDVAADINKFTAMVNGFLTAEPAYVSLGNSLPTYGAPPGMNMGDVTQKATVAYLMERVYAAAVATPGVGAANAIPELFALVNNQPNSVANVQTNPTNPLNPLPGWLQNIYAVSGAPLPK